MNVKIAERGLGLHDMKSTITFPENPTPDDVARGEYHPAAFSQQAFGEFGAFSPFRGESGRGEALSGSFLGREGPQKSTPYPGFKLEFKKTHLKSKNST